MLAMEAARANGGFICVPRSGTRTIPYFVTMPTKGSGARPYDKKPKKDWTGTRPFGQAVGKQAIPEKYMQINRQE